MNSQIEKIKAFIKDHDNKKNRIVAGGVCAVLVLGLVGIGVGLNMANSAPVDPAKALTQAEDNNDKKADENTDNKDGSTEQSENTSETTEEVTVNENGEVVDENGNVVAESVEAYNATPQAQSRPVNATSGNTSNTPSSHPSASAGGSSQPSHVHTWATRTIKEATSEPIKSWLPVGSHVECLVCGAPNPSTEHLYNHAITVGRDQTTVVEDFDWVVTGYKPIPAVTETYCTGCGAKQ